jgi:predicted ATP-binding protein involved in virulence
LAEGIVFIDEIGTHLHPRWKMEIVDRLRKTFPKIQFIITTHEPLCLRGLKDNEVVVLRRNSKDSIEALSDLPNPSSLRVDQLLTSEYFGLNSTIDPKIEKLFKEYYDLVAINDEDRTEAQKSEIVRLKEEIDEKNYMRFGNDLREELVYQAVDELIAKDIRQNSLKIETKDIKKQTISKVQDLWKSIPSKK